MSTQGENQLEQSLVAPANINASVVNNIPLQANGGTNYGDLPVSTSSGEGVDVKEEPNKKTDEPPKIKRPMNPFMIFGCEKRRKLAQVHPRMHNSEISKILGAEWKRMSEYDKAPYVQEAKRLKEQHSIEYPNYKFKANRRKPRQAIKKERPTFPYATADINAIPTAMKFPYPAPFFQDPMYASMSPSISTSHPAYASMYSDYSITARPLPAGSAIRAGSQTPVTSASTGGEYYGLNKSGTTGSATDFYGSMSSKGGDYYSGIHSGTAVRADRSPSGGELVNIQERYGSSENRQFENRYNSSFNGSQASNSGSYTSMQNISPHVSNETTATAYTYTTNPYDQRH